MLYKITTHSLFYKGKYYPVGTILELPNDIATTLPNTVPVKEEEKKEEEIPPQQEGESPRKKKSKLNKNN